MRDTKPESRVVFAASKYDELLAKGTFQLNSAEVFNLVSVEQLGYGNRRSSDPYSQLMGALHCHLGCGDQAEDCNAQSKYEDHEKLEQSG